MPLLALALANTAAAAPLLGSKASFNDSAFCKTYGCKYITTVPTESEDQFIYDLKDGQRIIVWRSTTDKKRNMMGKGAEGKIQGISLVWYELQDRPFEVENKVADLIESTTGKRPTKTQINKWLDNMDDKNTMNEINKNAYVDLKNMSFPGTNVFSLYLTVQINPMPTP